MIQMLLVKLLIGPLISISNGTSNLPLTTTTLSDPGTYTLNTASLMMAVKRKPVI